MQTTEKEILEQFGWVCDMNTYDDSVSGATRKEGHDNDGNRLFKQKTFQKNAVDENVKKIKGSGKGMVYKPLFCPEEEKILTGKRTGEQTAYWLGGMGAAPLLIKGLETAAVGLLATTSPVGASIATLASAAATTYTPMGIAATLYVGKNLKTPVEMASHFIVNDVGRWAKDAWKNFLGNPKLREDHLKSRNSFGRPITRFPAHAASMVAEENAEDVFFDPQESAEFRSFAGSDVSDAEAQEALNQKLLNVDPSRSQQETETPYGSVQSFDSSDEPVDMENMHARLHVLRS